MTTFSIERRMDELDVAKMLEDERVPEAINEILRAMAIDESTRPLWPACPMDQMYASLNEWMDTMLAARDYKHGELSAEMFRARLVILAGNIERAIVNLETQ